MTSAPSLDSAQALVSSSHSSGSCTTPDHDFPHTMSSAITGAGDLLHPGDCVAGEAGRDPYHQSPGTVERAGPSRIIDSLSAQGLSLGGDLLGSPCEIGDGISSLSR